jgi:hypothetical protein
MKNQLTAIAFAVLACVACGGGQDDELPGNGEVSAEIADADGDVRLPPRETAEEPFGPETLDVGAEADGLNPDSFPADLPVGPGPGEAGWPCKSGQECNYGYCIQTGDGMQCTQTCDDECPFGWQCTLYTLALPDAVYLCIPPFAELCKPCGENAECWTNGADGGQACVSYGPDGFFCGGPCETGADCPDGYHCGESDDASGQSGLQCVRSAGQCPCKQWYADQGAATNCYVENQWGKCLGERECKASGLTDCSASAPAQEACNGADDDCDGSVDEETSGKACTIPSELGNCPGTEECIGGKIVCQGKEASQEACNGKDDDCDGAVDEGFDDTDKDGVADCLENDKDGDAISDGLDNCPSVFNPAQTDSDFDSLGDLCDLDDDNDKSPDDQDCAPTDDEAFPGADEECDGMDNNCNFLVDEGFADYDGDGLKDCADEDDDNDGTADALDCGPNDAEVHPAADESCDGKDNNCNFLLDEGFADLDEDQAADCVDPDLDGDGVKNGEDVCPQIPNPGQEDLDKDKVGDLCDTDADGDGIPDQTDNCPGVKNGPQLDTDKDGLGNECDQDLDGDGKDNDSDNCPLISNPAQSDSDKDGTGDACEDDKDGDGVPDGADCAPLDPTTLPGQKESCDGKDNNCDFLIDEGFKDSDLDGLKDCVDSDDDGDGDPDESDCAPLDSSCAAGKAEVCDGKDNDCNGDPDDDIGLFACGKGDCFHIIEACIDGKTQWCDPNQGISLEKCDGKDNDCDGLIDEDQGSATCGLGLCVHTVQKCVKGAPVACDPLDGSGPETCDGKDNDCDGMVDDGLGAVTCGLGICLHTEPACVDGQSAACDPKKGAWPEVCDGLDNDCDGAADEELGTVTCGKGSCQHEQPYCDGGKVTICDPFLGVAVETCDGLDNDCDGLTDEDIWPLSCGQGACAHTVPGCANGLVPVCDPLEGAADEVCDGKDNNCNGLADEGFGWVSCGLGQCLHSVPKCLNGVPQECDPEEGKSIEICDYIDNDCDGIVDPEDTEGCEPFFLDSDGDGYGLEDNSKCLCHADQLFSASLPGDCLDSDADVNPAAAEDCGSDGDEDCSGAANDGCVYASCKEVMTSKPGATDGVHDIDPDGVGPVAPFKVWCDLTTAGGGWALVMQTSSTSAYLYDNAVWTQTTGGASQAGNPAVDQDYVSAGFYVIQGTESRMALGTPDNWNSWYHAKNTARNLSNQPRMAGNYAGFGTCPAKTNCGTEPIAQKPMGLQAACSQSGSTKWHRFGYVNDDNGWGTSTRVGFTGDNDGSDSSDSIMGMGIRCFSSCVSSSCTGSPHAYGAGFYLYVGWATPPLDESRQGFLWIR